MVAPETENPQEPSGEANASTEKPQDPPGEAIASSIHGDAEPSSIRNLADDTSTEKCDRNDEKKKEAEGGEEKKDKGKKKLEDEDDDIDDDHEKTLEYAQVLMDKGSTAFKEKDYETAVECYSRALEIRVIHFGELDQECFSAYYFYGLALLRNALSGPLSVSNEDGSTLGESRSISCASSHKENDESADSEDSPTDNSDSEDTPTDNSDSEDSATEISDSEDSATEISDSEDSATGSKEEEYEFDSDDTPNNDEDDLDLAWQILDIARIIVEKRPTPSMDNVNVLCALGEINDYRDDYARCLVDYGKAMDILGDLGDPDLFLKAKTHYKMGLCVEMSVRTEEKFLYYEHALSSCSIMLKSLEKDLDSFLSEKIAVPDTSISKKREEIAEVQNFSEMLKRKMQDEREDNNKYKADISRAVNAFSAKVRKLEEDVCSRSSSAEYAFLAILGVSRKTIHFVRGNSFDFSTSISSDSDDSSCQVSSNAAYLAPPESSNAAYLAPPESSNAHNLAPPESSNAHNLAPPESSNAHNLGHLESSNSDNSNSSDSSSSSSDSDNPKPLKIPKLDEPDTEGSAS